MLLADRTLVGVFVDPDDALLERVLARVPLHALQLHGAETPERVQAIRARTGRIVIKALPVAEARGSGAQFRSMPRSPT